MRNALFICLFLAAGALRAQAGCYPGELTRPEAEAKLRGFAKEHETDHATKIVLLGTGTPNAEPERSGPAVAIIVNDTPYLIDCGPGIVRRANAAYRSGIAGLAPASLRFIFITHLHSDHTAGYADLILTPWVLERDQPLQAYGPPGLKDMTAHLLAAYKEDIRTRLDGREPINENGYKVNAVEIEEGVVYRDSNVVVEAFAVFHGAWEYAFGYRFTSADRTIVISGDSRPSEKLIEYAEGCDVLIHEVYSAEAFAKRPPVWQRYHADSHTSTRELAEIASRVQPGLLILYHQLYWGVSDEELLTEIKALYDGVVISGADLEVY